MRKLFFTLGYLPFLVAGQAGLSTPNPIAGYDFLNRQAIFNPSGLTEEGTLFFPTKVSTANIKLKNGRYYTNMKAVMNLLDNELLFQDSLNQLYTAIVPVQSVEFIPGDMNINSIFFKTGFPPIDGNTENTFYEVLAEGKATLLKAYRISYIDRTPIDRSVSIRHYDTKTFIYLFDGSHIRKLSRNKSDIENALLYRQNAFQTYVSSHKINWKSDSDLAALFNFINSN